MEYQNVELVHVHSCPVCKKQGWEFAHSLSLLCSKSLILKSELFSLLFKKERCEWFTRDSSESIAKNGQSAKKIVFFVCFSNRSRRSSLSRSFVKITLSDLLPSLFTKEQQWEIHSSRSWQKSDGAIRSFSQANRSSALLLTKNEQISRKTDEWIPYPSKKMVCPVAHTVPKISWILALKTRLSPAEADATRHLPLHLLGFLCGYLYYWDSVVDKQCKALTESSSGWWWLMHGLCGYLYYWDSVVDNNARLTVSSSGWWWWLMLFLKHKFPITVLSFKVLMFLRFKCRHFASPFEL